jgi:hypothetical protein
VPGDPVVEEPDRDAGAGDDEQVRESPDHQRGHRIEQLGQVERATDRRTENPGAEKERDERQRRGQRPHHGAQASDRNAEHVRPLAAFRRGANRRTSPRPVEEQRHEPHHDRRHHQGDEVVGEQASRADVPFPRQQLRQPFRGGVTPPPAGHEDAEHDEQLIDAEGCHGEHEARRVAESTDEDELDHCAQHDRDRESDDEPNRVSPSPEDDECHRKRRGHRAQVGLGEVQDAVGSIDQREPDREHRRQQAEHDAPDGLAPRQRVLAEQSEQDHADHDCERDVGHASAGLGSPHPLNDPHSTENVA